MRCRAYQLPCCGEGVLPSLRLSHSVVNFAATAVGDVSSAVIAVHNPKLSRLNSAVIRGAVQPQGAKSFEFALPSSVPLTLSPAVATVPLGEVRREGRGGGRVIFHYHRV